MADVQWIVVDDTDPRISYSGAWSTQGQASLKDMGQFGAPLLLTSHGTATNSSFSFSFSGTQLVVSGSQLVPTDTKSSGGTCAVDGVTQPIVYDTQNATNRVLLCKYVDLTENRHTFVLDAVPAGNKPFWFDYLRYLPTPDVPTTNESVIVFSDDQDLTFDKGWKIEAPDDVKQVSTNTTNSTMSYTFVGTSIAWFGSYDHSTFLRPANLSYVIDRGDPNVVPIRPSTNFQADITMQQLIFNASGLSPGVTHDLKVTYLGSPQSVPLSLNNFVITWGPLPGNNSSSVIPSTSGASPPPSPTNSPATGSPSAVSNHKSSSVVKTAVAVSIVGAAVILGSIILFVVARRRRRQRAASAKTIELDGPDMSPRPFLVSNTSGSENKQSHPGGSASAEVVPQSKAQMAQVAPPLTPSSAAGTAGPSTSDVNTSPVERDAATYLWSLLLRHQRDLSVEHIQHHGGSADPSNTTREANSPHPPAYDM